jgi:hypothetical protein
MVLPLLAVRMPPDGLKQITVNPLEIHREKMKYGQIAGNRHINAMIYRCFGYIREEDERKFITKFHEQPQDGNQIMHTFRELVLGAYLSSNGFRIRYDHTIATRTPDWSILDERLSVKGIVELTNFHVDKVTEDTIEEQLRVKGVACVWRDQNKDNIDRLYHCIRNKAEVYKALLEKLEVPYVISVFGEFKAAIDFDEELCPCLLDKEFGLFGLYPEVSGVLYFEEKFGGFLFRYIHNPTSLRKIDLPSGLF